MSRYLWELRGGCCHPIITEMALAGVHLQLTGDVCLLLADEDAQPRSVLTKVTNVHLQTLKRPNFV